MDPMSGWCASQGTRPFLLFNKRKKMDFNQLFKHLLFVNLFPVIISPISKHIMRLPINTRHYYACNFAMEKSREKPPRAFKLCNEDKGQKIKGLYSHLSPSPRGGTIFFNDVSSPNNGTKGMSPNDLREEKDLSQHSRGRSWVSAPITQFDLGIHEHLAPPASSKRS